MNRSYPIKRAAIQVDDGMNLISDEFRYLSEIQLLCLSAPTMLGGELGEFAQVSGCSCAMKRRFEVISPSFGQSSCGCDDVALWRTADHFA